MQHALGTFDMKNERRPGVEQVRAELEDSQGVGVALVILDKNSLQDDDPKFWTISELVDKPQTARYAGQKSVPAETRKVNESALKNLFGGVAEFTDSEEVLSRLRYLPGEFYVKSAIKVNGNSADVAVLVYDSSVEVELKPFDLTEIEPAGWMRFSEAERLNGEMRPVARDSLLFTMDSGLARSIVDNSEALAPIRDLMGKDFTFQGFIDDRNKAKDLI